MKEQEIANIFKGKKLLYIPVVSSINRETGDWKLDCDGNVNRFITVFSRNNTFKDLTVIIPENCESKKFIEKWEAENDNVRTITTRYFGEHALDQRNYDTCANLVEKVRDVCSFHCYDHVIFDSQGVGERLIDAGYEGLIFWNQICPLENVVKKTRDWLEGHDYYNRNEKLYLSRNVEYMFVGSPDIYTEYEVWYGKKIANQKLVECYNIMNRTLSIFNEYNVKQEVVADNNKYKTVWYLPYRLTDSAYKFADVLNYIAFNINKEHDCIKFANPNNAKLDIPAEFSDLWEKYATPISTDRDTYYTMIDCKNVKIPYFEDINYSTHASVFEFMDAKCQVVWAQYNDKSINLVYFKYRMYNFIPIYE